MRRQTDNKIILITRPTRVAELKRRFSTVTQAKFYVSHLGQDFSDYEREDEHYASAVRVARQTLEKFGRVQVIDRSFLPNFVFGPQDLIVILGQDGLVANTVKYLNAQPVIGVNPDPARWDGQLLPFKLQDLSKVVPEVMERHRPVKAVTMAKAALNTGEVMYAVNDLFIGPRSHVSARYSISSNGVTENQSSSGIIVSTGVGSTGWFKSLMAGAKGIARMEGRPEGPPPLPRDQRKKSTREDDTSFPWDAGYLCFTVREPFASKTSQASLIFGFITGKEPLVLVSQMPENGVIFSDGVEQDFLEFRSGTRAIIGIADKQGCLVV